MVSLLHKSIIQVALGDQDLAAFFRDERENLKDSFVFVFADHGHRSDAIRETVIGRIEERMPFFSMHVPDWLQQQRPYLHNVLQKNSQVCEEKAIESIDIRAVKKHFEKTAFGVQIFTERGRISTTADSKLATTL